MYHQLDGYLEIMQIEKQIRDRISTMYDDEYIVLKHTTQKFTVSTDLKKLVNWKM